MRIKANDIDRLKAGALALAASVGGLPVLGIAYGVLAAQMGYAMWVPMAISPSTSRREVPRLVNFDYHFWTTSIGSLAQ